MLIQCPECGNKVSDEALSCPKCGHPLKKNDGLDENKPNSFTVAYRSKPGSVFVSIIIIGIVGLINLVGSILCFTASNKLYKPYLIALAIVTIVLAALFLFVTARYVVTFIFNHKNKYTNCIEYNHNENKLVLCTVYGKIIKIDIADYVEYVGTFLSDTALFFIYKTSGGKCKKVNLGYCDNREQIRFNINKARKMHE